MNAPLASNMKKTERSLWPAAIVAFFAVAIVGCVSFVVFCNLHPADLVSANYYEQEMRFQSQLDRMQRGLDMGPLASISYESGRRLLVISLPPDHAASQLAGSVQLYRPSSSKLDRNFPLLVSSAGTQEIDAAELAPGLWKVKVTWSADGREFFITRQIHIKS